jgi:hypothetical protein
VRPVVLVVDDQTFETMFEGVEELEVQAVLLLKIEVEMEARVLIPF